MVHIAKRNLDRFPTHPGVLPRRRPEIRHAESIPRRAAYAAAVISSHLSLGFGLSSAAPMLLSPRCGARTRRHRPLR